MPEHTKKDVFGTGMIGFQIVTLRDPPNRTRKAWAEFRNKTRQNPWLEDSSFYSKLGSAIKDCLCSNPELRPSAKTLTKTLNCWKGSNSVNFMRSALNSQIQPIKNGPLSSCQKSATSHLWKSSSASKCHHIRYIPSPTGIEEVVSQNSNGSGRN